MNASSLSAMQGLLMEKTRTEKPKFPERRHYEYFVGGLSRAAVEMRICFFLYGSYTRPDDFIPGRSDVDGGFIFDRQFSIPQSSILPLASAFDSCFEKTEKITRDYSQQAIHTNFNIMDRGVNEDGRFLAYDSTYTDYLKKNAVVIGPDFVREMRGLNYKRECVQSAAHNLRKTRNGLLTFFVDRRHNPERAKKNILSSMNVLAAMPKKLLEAQAMDFEFRKNSFFQNFREMLPDYDTGFYEKVAASRKDPAKYFGVLSQDGFRSFSFYHKCVNETEKMIEAYVRRFPKISNWEVKA